jgi:prepilin-type N-terminal cleavage/methylation domain-containing protein
MRSSTVQENATGARRAFTLIELLIVVAIIAILAAIAVPNFLAAQTRAKVSRGLSDLRTMRIATESYAVDNNRYPRSSWGCAPFNDQLYGEPVWGTFTSRITTPIQYMTTIPLDVFAQNVGEKITDKLYAYGTVDSTLYYLFSSPPPSDLPGPRRGGIHLHLRHAQDRPEDAALHGRVLPLVNRPRRPPDDQHRNRRRILPPV